MKLIGFNGGMGVGKSTAIELLPKVASDSKATIRLIKFAQPLYDIQEFIYKRIGSVYIRPSTFVKDRKLLQWIGTDWGRDSISTTLWVDLWKHEVKYLQENYPHDIVVCDDVRFDNEAQAIHEMGGHVVKIVADRAAERITTANGIQGHKSESGISLELVDFVLENNGTLEDLEASLCTLLRELEVGRRDAVA